MKTVYLKKNLLFSGNLILVNAEYPYKKTEDHRNLIPLDDVYPKIFLESHTATLLSKLMDEINGWERICAVSGWRSEKEQQKLYIESGEKKGAAFTKKYVALPSHSEHETGLAVDLALLQDSIDFVCPHFPYNGICQSFREKSIPYGFIERYPKEKEEITRIAHEPWHFRYVGAPHAEIMKKFGFVLEEYLMFLKHYPYGKRFFIYHTNHMDIFVSYLKANDTSSTYFEIAENVPTLSPATIWTVL